MKVITVCSAKGGVGKTTITANLGVGIAQRGFPVLLIDLDPQNALRWHLGGLDEYELDGLSATGIFKRKLSEATFVSPFGVDFIPYGVIDEENRQGFEHLLANDPDWLKKALKKSALPANTVVLLDTPPGPTVYLKQAMRAANFALLVLLADMASYATVNAMEGIIETYRQGNPQFSGSAFILNQGSTNQLAQDIISTLQTHYGSRVSSTIIHRHPQVEEALAFERPLLHYNPDCDPAQDLQHLVDWVLQILQQTSAR